MELGARVRASDDTKVHEAVRGREGEVIGPGYNGTTSVLFDGDSMPRSVATELLIKIEQS